MKKLGEGAEAKIFETVVFGKRAVIKVRQEKKYRIGALDMALRISRTRREARLMRKAHAVGVGVPRIIALGRFSIYMERLGGKLLKDRSIRKSGYERVGALLADLHNAGIVHGDFTPANVMVDERKFNIIDFGLAEESNSPEERAIDLLLMKRSIPKDCYGKFKAGYAKRAARPGETLGRLSEVEKRGRYQVRTLL
jgi:Kae1-associated kinase Bud32